MSANHATPQLAPTVRRLLADDRYAEALELAANGNAIVHGTYAAAALAMYGPNLTEGKRVHVARVLAGATVSAPVVEGVVVACDRALGQHVAAYQRLVLLGAKTMQK